MKFKYSHLEIYEYFWICPLCFKTERLTHSTPMLGLNFVKLDLAIELWTNNCNSRKAHFIF